MDEQRRANLVFNYSRKNSPTDALDWYFAKTRAAQIEAATQRLVENTKLQSYWRGSSSMVKLINVE
jgi:hypothetical protein